MPDIALMNDKTHARALLKEIRDNNHGDSSPEIETGVVAVVEVAILVFPRHAATNLLNDNYCVVPTHFVSQLNRLDQNLDQKVVKYKVFLGSKDLSHQKVVYCQNVVTHVPSAILHGQLQKKSVGPVQSVSKIKVVKGVPCVNPLSFAPSVQNVPHVVTEISVGGRLQSFWQFCQKLGSNPRVVSVLRDGYSLPFRERPHLSCFPLIVRKYASPVKSKALLEALSSLIQKKAVEKVVVWSSLVIPSTTVFFLFPNPTKDGIPFWI